MLEQGCLPFGWRVCAGLAGALERLAFAGAKLSQKVGAEVG